MKNTDKFIFLSHPLNNETIGYGGKKTFQSDQVLSLSKGDSCNQSKWTLSNHIGTHIDAPFHFSNHGKTLDELPAKFWIFDHPELIELPLQSGDILTPGSWCENISNETDLLLIKTNFEKFRGEDPYWAQNPGLSPELAQWLRKYRKNIRCIGFDFISITSYLHRDLGKIAHRAFLGEQIEGLPILPIEDMHLKHLQQSPKTVTVLPLRIEKSDGSPVTVIAEI